ncbi:MAG: polyribonucleotide nucleotidyltransferase [Ignavibacteriaceae bacterium]|nr:polyribonucleotide nucleotidyltransferase [Ignavibacteriaceae bacterium]
MVFIKEVEIGGKIISIETGRYARQANGAVMVRSGETMVLVAAVAAPEAKEDQDFFPLQVEYREKTSAAGKFPGGFIKREGKPSEKEVLSARLIDRPIRPLFPDYYRNDTQVIATVFSYDGENDADVLAACGASAALMLGGIPFNGPVGEVRVGRVNGQLVCNPTHSEIAAGDLELVVAGTEDSIMMVEGEAKELSEEVMLEALMFAHAEIKKIVAMQKELFAEAAKPVMQVVANEIPAEIIADVKELAYEKYKEVVASVLAKEERAAKNNEIDEATLAALAEKYPEQESKIKQVLHDIEKELMRERILSEGKRLDGRGTTDIRPITIELGVLPRSHGSALFTRGETQSLGTVTLGTKNDEQIIDGLREEYTKSFMLHYNFPPYSVGEVGRYTGTGRREIGHGNLAERSLKNMIDADAKFPYTLRITSDILESNGSSSMATVCSGSLSMFDGGVPLKRAVAGIAMGLIKEGERYAILSDILGNEDHLGDMDFKVAGTSEGITGLQMDIKIEGISFEIMKKALEQAKEGRMHILGIMNAAIDQPREELSKYAPRLVSMKIEQDQIGALIGPGGKTIQGLQREYNVEINVEDSGQVNIASANLDNLVKCQNHISRLFEVPEIGKIYEGPVTKLLDFGAVIEILPGKTGLLHVSEIDHKRTEKVTDVFKEGDIVQVKLLKIDGNKFGLSRKALLERPAREHKQGDHKHGDHKHGEHRHGDHRERHHKNEPKPEEPEENIE